ncbi:tyrosine-type recombinase/integrase [Halomonas hibernica]|uniref:tyrosine-type recombinase/integrase n=1 Tax=Halomonas hibernica TaxID=2591147 RepID=UPI0015532240|nr:integrase family protein [Halomonas hibernica]
MKTKTRTNHSQRRILTDAAIRSLAVGKTATESLPGRGTGAILFEARPSGNIESYFRVRINNKSQKIKVGMFKSSARSTGLSLAEIREIARTYSLIALEHGDVKNFFQEQKDAKEREISERELAFSEALMAVKTEKTTASFEELFTDYIESLEGTTGPSYIKELKRVLNNVLKPNHQFIMDKKAKDIIPKDILEILQPIWDRGSENMSGKVRAYLHSSFEYGLKNENSLKRKTKSIYCLERNPVSSIPKDHKTKAIKRALSAKELNYFWHSFLQYESVGPVVTRFLLFLIATGGQRVMQVAREPWTSYDLRKGILKTEHRKGNTPPRIHLVPLTERAIKLLQDVHSVNPHSKYPWSTSGKIPIDINTLRGAVNKWLSSPISEMDGKEFEKFTPRDLRRTCSQLMQIKGITNLDSDILQSHGINGVVEEHYRNNPYAFMPKNWNTINLFEEALNDILKGKDLDKDDIYKFSFLN